MRAFVTGGLLLVTTPALADERTDTRVGALHDRVDPVVSWGLADLDLGWRLDGALASRSSAAGGRADTEGTASLGAEVAWSSEACDAFRTGGQVDVTVGGGAPVSAQQWTSVCPLGDEMMTMQLDNLVQWDVVPSLLARPRLRPTASRVETFSVTLGATLDDVEGPGYLSFVETTMGISMGWVQGDFVHADTSVSATMAMIGYHVDREDGDVPYDLDVISIDVANALPGDNIDGDPNNDRLAMLARLDAVRWSGSQYLGLRIDGALGVGLLDVSVDAAHPQRDTLVTVAEAELAVERDLDEQLTLRAYAGRTHWPVFDARAVIDDRASLALTRHAGRVRLRAEGFAAMSYLIAADHEITRSATGGLTCIAETDLGAHAVMRVRSDVGRGFYAAGATLDQPRVAGEVLATIDIHTGNL